MRGAHPAFLTLTDSDGPYCLKIHKLKPQPLVPQNVSVFGDGQVIKVKRGH